MIVPLLTQSNSPHLSKFNTGLGNALFQIFTAYGLSKKYNHTFNNYCLIELLVKLKNFSLNHSDTIFRNLKLFQKILDNKVVMREKHNYYSLYDEDLVKNINNINDDTCILLQGYVQSHMYFDNYYDEIIELIKSAEGNEYLTGLGKGSQRYTIGNEEEFEKNGISVKYSTYKETKYQQVNGDFISNLSILDMIFNIGEKETIEKISFKKIGKTK